MLENVSKKPPVAFPLALLIFTVSLLVSASPVIAGCYVKWTGLYDTSGRDNFSTKEECERIRRRGPSERGITLGPCVCDSPRSSPGKSDSGYQRISRQEEEFEEDKRDLLKGLKGFGDSGSSYTPELKGFGDTAGDSSMGLKSISSEAELRAHKRLGALSCSAFWAQKAADAALSGNYNKARSLGYKSSDYMNKSNMANCGKGDIVIPEPGQPEIPKLTKLYRFLQKKSLQISRKVTTAKKRAQRKKTEALKKDKIYTEIFASSQLRLKKLDALPQSKEVEKKKKKEKKRLLDAKKLLEETGELLEESKKDEAAAEKMAQEAKRNMKLFKDVYKNAQKNPENAAEYIRILEEG